MALVESSPPNSVNSMLLNDTSTLQRVNHLLKALPIGLSPVLDCSLSASVGTSRTETERGSDRPSQLLLGQGNAKNTFGLENGLKHYKNLLAYSPLKRPQFDPSRV